MVQSVRMSVVCSLCVLMFAACCCDPVMDSEVAVRPTRPKNFGSPEELRLYLDQIGQYYAVVGRPRFGKRSEPEVRRPVFSRQLVPGYLYPYPQLADSSGTILYYQLPQQE